jgi:TolB-like protein
MSAAVIRFLKELRRRRVFRVAGLYVVGVWLLMQAADILFPAWGIPDAAIRYLSWAGLLCFPVALVFGWVFDITPEGIRRTQPVGTADELLRSLPLRRTDFVILAAFVVVIGLIGYDAIGRALRTTQMASMPEMHIPAAAVTPNSLAVLPFASMSSDPEHEYFADGVSEEILNRLSAFGELKVIARTSSFAFKDSGFDIARISSLLGVQHLLQGSVRRDGQQLRITAQLIDRSGVQVWNSSFDRQLGAIFALQDEIAEAVATSILRRIVPRVAERREPDLEAYQQYLVGREILARRTSLWFERSVVHFDRAIELDPEFAEPFAGRAMGLVMGALWYQDRTDRLTRAAQDIDRALALNPELAMAYAAQALLEQQRAPEDHAGRELLLRRALELDPNLVDALDGLSSTLAAQGRHEESLEILRKAVRLDPLAPVVHRLAWDEAQRGDFAAAERRMLSQLEIPQPSIESFGNLSHLYGLHGRMVESCVMAQRMVLAAADSSGRPGALHILARRYALLGSWEAAEAAQLRWETEWREGRAVPLLYRHLILEGGEAPAQRLAGVKAAIQQAGIDPAGLDRMIAARLFELQALQGDYAPAIHALEGWIDPAVPWQGGGAEEIRARHALAWAWLQTGRREQARGMLLLLDAHFAARQREGRLHLSEDIFTYARNALLLGETDRALELFDQAAAAGWREYHALEHDPRWDALREEPRFVESIARIKSDIDGQRARMTEIDATDDFATRLDTVLAAKKAGSSRP